MYKPWGGFSSPLSSWESGFLQSGLMGSISDIRGKPCFWEDLSGAPAQKQSPPPARAARTWHIQARPAGPSPPLPSGVGGPWWAWAEAPTSAKMSQDLGGLGDAGCSGRPWAG